MANYDFKNLSPWEFEKLSRDLLRAALGIDFELFKSGRDGGIDLRYAEDRDHKVIAQCKHYANSPFATLKHNLKFEELEKIERLAPARYILVTSLGMTPANKDEIATILGKYLISTADIVTKETLNAWLADHPSIERNHINLWASSINVIETIFHSGIFNYSAAQKEQLEAKLKYYVKNPSFDEAKQVLEEQHFCVIAGIPGIGKTTLAEMLLVDYMRDGYEPIRISTDISEAFQTYNPNEKRIYYYDDFLGQTGLEQKLNKNEDQRIVEFCQRCAKSDKTLFILTTREYILNQAKITYEKLGKSKLDINKCVIDISSYALLDRGKILYNHLYFGNMPDEYKKQVLKDRQYLDIVKHPSFNPRVIEWMTDQLSTSDVPSDHYVQEIMARLHNPAVIWDHVFRNQIADITRHLLLVILSAPNEVFLSDSKRLHDDFRNVYCDRYGSSRTHNEFNFSIKEAEGNFIRMDLAAGRQIIQFHNPSIRDYVTYYLSGESDLLSLVLKSCSHFDQLVAIWNAFNPLQENPLIDDKDLQTTYQGFLANLIGSTPLRLTRYSTSGGGYKFNYASQTIKDHCRFILSTGMNDISSALKNAMSKALDDVFANLTAIYDWSDIVALLKVIDPARDSFDLDFNEYMRKTLNVFPDSLNQVADYAQLAELCDGHKLAAKELSADYPLFLDRLESNLNDELDYIDTVDDLGALEECLSDIKRVNEVFGGQLEDRVDQINELIDKLLEQEPDEKDRVPVSSRRQNKIVDDEKDVISLFDTLI